MRVIYDKQVKAEAVKMGRKLVTIDYNGKHLKLGRNTFQVAANKEVGDAVEKAIAAICKQMLGGKTVMCEFCGFPVNLDGGPVCCVEQAVKLNQPDQEATIRERWKERSRQQEEK